jgi:hypothetical protein
VISDFGSMENDESQSSGDTPIESCSNGAEAESSDTNEYDDEDDDEAKDEEQEENDEIRELRVCFRKALWVL